MKFSDLSQARIIEPDVYSDNRGFLSITYIETEFLAAGLNTQWVTHLSTTTKGIGVVRGMHWQSDPFHQIKLVRCMSGKVIDVIVDIRGQSPLFGKPFYVELSEENRLSLYIPAWFAHGFQTLSHHCVMDYLISERYAAECVRSFNPCDPGFDFTWPIAATKLSSQDASAPPLCHIRQYRDENFQESHVELT